MDNDFYENIRKLYNSHLNKIPGEHYAMEKRNLKIQNDISVSLRLASECIFEINKKLGELILIQNTKSK